MHEVIRRRNLPHWDVPGAAFFVTTCLEGSIPARGLLEIADYRAELSRRVRPANRTEEDWANDRWKLAFTRTDEWLDQRPAVRHLADERLAKLVVESLYFFAGERYDLFAFVVMPSHIHWVFRPCEAWVATLPRHGKRTPRERIVHSINRHTSATCNKLLRQEGAFWQHESYDHWVRDADELERIIRYVEANPVKAGLAASPDEWRFSSAYDRKRQGPEFGLPLLEIVAAGFQPARLGKLKTCRHDESGAKHGTK